MTAKEFYEKSEIFKSDSLVNMYKEDIIKLMEDWVEQRLMEEWDYLEDNYERDLDNNFNIFSP